MTSSKRKPRILVVDDQPSLAWALTEIMRREGIDASSFRNPLHLLHFSTHNAPDVVVTDLLMPEMTGVDLARRLISKHPGCKIILFSGSCETSILDAWAQEQNVRVISKPIQVPILLEHIREFAAI